MQVHALLKAHALPDMGNRDGEAFVGGDEGVRMGMDIAVSVSEHGGGGC